MKYKTEAQLILILSNDRVELIKDCYLLLVILISIYILRLVPREEQKINWHAY